MHYKLYIIKKSSFNYNNVTIPILFCNTAFFFKNNENGRGCEAHEREGAKKALSWGFVFKNHNSQNHNSQNSQFTILHEVKNSGSSDGAHFCCLPVELTKIFCEFVLDFVHPLHKSD